MRPMRSPTHPLRSLLAVVMALAGTLVVTTSSLAQDELFVTNSGNGSSVTVYGQTAAGSTPPLSSIQGCRVRATRTWVSSDPTR